MLVLLRGDVRCAKRIAKYQAEKSGIEDKDEIKELVAKRERRAKKDSKAFKIQLAAVVDGGFALVHSTYALEVDGVSGFFAWELWNLAKGSIKLFSTIVDADEAVMSDFGLPLANLAVWRNHTRRVRNIFEPAWTYLLEQEKKHSENLKIFENLNALCPWNAKKLTVDVLKFFVSKKIIEQSLVDLIIRNNEISLFEHYGLNWPGALQPSPTEYFLRLSPKTFLPEARVWRFWYGHHLVLPHLSVLVRIVAPLVSHSAAAERAGSLFTHDKNSQTDSASVQLAVIRQRAHYDEVVRPNQNMPLEGVEVLPSLHRV